MHYANPNITTIYVNEALFLLHNVSSFCYSDVSKLNNVNAKITFYGIQSQIH